MKWYRIKIKGKGTQQIKEKGSTRTCIRLPNIKMGPKPDDHYKVFVQLITLNSVLQALH